MQFLQLTEQSLNSMENIIYLSNLLLAKLQHLWAALEVIGGRYLQLDFGHRRHPCMGVQRTVAVI